MNKEQVYDEKVAPLMTQIIAICQEHKIAMLATFAIPTKEDSDLLCTTCISDETGRPPEPILSALRVVRPPVVMLTTRNADGSTDMTAIVP